MNTHPVSVPAHHPVKRRWEHPHTTRLGFADANP